MTAPTPPVAPSPTGPSAPEPPAQTFTQDDVNRIVSERLARQAKNYEGFDDLKAKAAEYDRLQEQSASDIEKAAKKAADEARAAMTESTNTRLVRAEVKAAAAAANFHDPADAAALLERRFTSVKVDDHGDVDEAAVKALVDELAQSKPHLVKALEANGTRPLPGQGTPTSGAVGGKEAGLAEARRRFPQKTTP